MDFKAEIINALERSTGFKDIQLEIPPDSKMGDFAFPCFTLAKSMKKAPQKISEELAGKVVVKDITAKAEGPYLNFFVSRAAYAETVLTKVFKEKEYGKAESKEKTIMLEFFHANTHKGVHIGHVRNICMGISLARLLEFAGYKVIRVNYQGDIGPHVAKCIWGYMHSEEKEPEKQRGVWLGKIYAKASQKAKDDPEVEEEIRRITKRLYDEDNELMPLWQKTRQWCLDDFETLYKEFDVKFDRLYFESEAEPVGKKEVHRMLEKGIAEESEGAIIINLEEYGLGVFLLLRSDGVGLYSTKDIGLAKIKQKEYKADKSLHLVGKEQELYFRQLFKTFELMGLEDFADKSAHLIYGLVMLPEGKMSSRDGTMVLYDELREKLMGLAYAEVRKRHSDWSEAEAKKAASQITFGALKFSMVSKEMNRQIIFDWEKAVDFEGETGPYIQYTHARICSILRKHGGKITEKVDFSAISEDEEKELVTLLGKYPETVEAAAEHYHSHTIARYLLDLAQKFNIFYHRHPVLKADENVMMARLLLIHCVKDVLRSGLALLGIEAPERM